MDTADLTLLENSQQYRRLRPAPEPAAAPKSQVVSRQAVHNLIEAHIALEIVKHPEGSRQEHLMLRRNKMIAELESL